MLEVICNYIKPYTVSNDILQDARDHARAELFGNAEENVKYSYALQDELVTKGHVCKLQFTAHRKVLCQVQTVVIKDELTCWANRKEPTLEWGKSRTNYMNDWTVEHELLLNDVLGFEDGSKIEVLDGNSLCNVNIQAPSSILRKCHSRRMRHMCHSENIPFFCIRRLGKWEDGQLGFHHLVWKQRQNIS